MHFAAPRFRPISFARRVLEGQCLSESGGRSADHDLFLVCERSAITPEKCVTGVDYVHL